jgi:hypothetical protein
MWEKFTLLIMDDYKQNADNGNRIYYDDLTVQIYKTYSYLK